jgi:hypothetical protein
MKFSDRTLRYALSCAAAAMLAGCGGSQPPIGATGAMPQTSTTAPHADRGKSWMLPGTSSGDLIYATGGCGGSCVISYPDLKLVATISTGGAAVCSDGQGNVFISRDDKVIKYAHGATEPIATLSVPGSFADGCSVDPLTNDLAVVYSGSVAIFQNEQGTPTSYVTHVEGYYCGYDDNGNLFVNGLNSGSAALSELPKGGSNFSVLTIDKSVGAPGQVQWDGKYVTYESVLPEPGKIFQLAISGSIATVVGTTKLGSVPHRIFQSWIYNGTVLVPFNIRGTRPNVVGLWDYPRGGKVAHTIRKFDSYKKRTISFQGVTVSVAPSEVSTR